MAREMESISGPIDCLGRQFSHFKTILNDLLVYQLTAMCFVEVHTLVM
jgi:hypothetical protein